MSEKIKIEIVYATLKKQYLYLITLKNEVTVEQAIISSSLLKLHRDVDLRKNKVGIYGHLVKLNEIVRDGDRIEIYRPKIADPRMLRRQRINNLGEKILHISSLNLKRTQHS